MRFEARAAVVHDSARLQPKHLELARFVFKSSRAACDGSEGAHLQKYEVTRTISACDANNLQALLQLLGPVH